MFEKSSAVHIKDGLCSDDGIVDAARVSFHKIAAQFTPTENEKLLRYLARFKHWSPYAHPRIAFSSDQGFTANELASLMINANLAGFNFDRSKHPKIVVGSLWGWYENLRFFPRDIAERVRWSLRMVFPIAGEILIKKPVVVPDCAVMISKFDDRLSNANLISESFRVRSSVFVARQAVKHQVHLAWNEVSRRYVDEAPGYYDFEQFRLRPEKSVKQGSGEPLAPAANDTALQMYRDHCRNSSHVYHSMMEELNIAPEQARAVLPVSHITEWVWTGTLEALHRVCGLRLDGHAQKEIAEIAEPINKAMAAKWPRAWRELSEREPDELG